MINITIFLIGLSITSMEPSGLSLQNYPSKRAVALQPNTRNHLLFKEQFGDLKNLKTWKKDYFNKWVGGEQSKLFVTFPEVMTKGIQKTYAGFWANKMTSDGGDKALLLTGDYEFTYYKFTGYDEKKNKHSYKFYKLRVNGETKLNEKSNFRFLLRDLELQQSNFEQNFVRSTIAIGYLDLLVNNKHFTMAYNLYLGGAIQTNISSYFPGIDNEILAPSGFSSTSGLELKFSFYKLMGYIKYQFSFLNQESMFNRTTIRLSIKNVILKDDYIWIQIDTMFPTGAALLVGNMFFVNYLKKF
jgi:hypothetical protein